MSTVKVSKEEKVAKTDKIDNKVDKEEIKKMIDSSVKEHLKKAIVELIKSKDDNMIELIEDTLLGMIMESDKKNESPEDFVDGKEFRKSLLDIMK